MRSLWFGDDLAKRDRIACCFDCIPLQNWSLSLRTLRALLRDNILMTIGDVLRANQDLLFIRRLGIAGFQELERKVAQIIAHADDASPAETEVASVFAAADPACLSTGMLPDAVQKKPLACFHLEAGIHRTLIKAGITTIGALYSIDRQQIKKLPELFPLECINATLISLARSIRENDVDWFEYCRLQNIQILPADLPANPSMEQLTGLLPHVLEEVLHREHGSRAWLIFKGRLTLARFPEQTLADLAETFALSRERVRQLEENIHNTLFAVFIEQQYMRRDYHIHPVMCCAITSIYEAIMSMPSQLFTVAQLLNRLRPRYDIDSQSLTPFLKFLSPFLGIGLITFKNASPLFIKGALNVRQRQTLQKAIFYIGYFLIRLHPLPCTEAEILAYVNDMLGEAEGISSSQLSVLVDICLSAEKCDDGKVQAHFACLWGRIEQAERVLAEAGQPMGTVDILQEIDHRLEGPGYRSVTTTYLHDQLVRDARFVALDYGERWGLKAWGLREYTVSTKVSPDWTMKRVADFVAGIFYEHQTEKLDYKIIRVTLMKAANINSYQALALLRRNPVIRTESPIKGNMRYAIFQPDYQEVLSQVIHPILRARHERQQNRLQIEERAYALLDAAPNKQMR